MKNVEEITGSAAGSQCLPSLFRFGYLQVLDVLTTLVFLMTGVQEANPLVRAVISATSNPLVALVYVKSFALLLGIYCWRRNRLRLLDRISVFYAFVVAWNLLALVVGTAARLS